MQTTKIPGGGGNALACHAFGSAHDPAVVLLPPSGQAGAFWLESAQALADAGRYAVCVDPRGQGASEHAPDGRYDLDAHVADLNAVLASLSSRAVVVGAGLGALVALAAMGEAGAQIASGMVLVDASVSFDQAHQERMHAALVERTSGANTPEQVRAAFSAAYPGESVSPVGEAVLSAFAVDDDGSLAWKGDPRSLTGPNLSEQVERLRAAAAKVAVPAVILRGTGNTTISADAARELQSLIPGAELSEIEGAGHFLAFERADAFNSVLLEFLERRAPRQPLTFIEGSEPRVLRDALGCFGTGVTIVTTFDEDAKPIGLTANSFTSVSLDPPLVLFSLAKSSANLSVFESAGRFGVNVLHIGQQPLSNRFIQRDIDRFDGVDWFHREAGGAPILNGTLASFDCSTYAVHDGGDHLIFIGKVEQAWYEPHRDPLLYFRGRYRRLHLN